MKKWFVAGALVLSLPALAQKKPAAGSKSIGQQYGCTSIMASPVQGMPRLDTANSRGLADQYYLWDIGANLRVRFLSGSPQMRARVKSFAKEWEQYANLTFTFVESGDAEIRVNLDDKGGHNSLIGQLALGIPQDVKTINFDTTDFQTYDAMHRTVLHEFGHAIGLLHEHYSPLAGIPWNKEAVYADLYRTQGWDRMTVDVNLFQQYATSYTQGTSYDRTSIMHYPILAKWTTNGYYVPWNNQLSAGDKAMIAALYPRSGGRSMDAPRFSILNFTKMTVVNSSAKSGLLIYPSFNLKTSGSEGQVYFIAFFFDENGSPIMDNDDKYNVSNVVATYKGFKFAPGKLLSANKNSPTDFELFIPYSEIPVSPGTKLQVVFRAILKDGDEFKFLYSSNPVNFSLIKN